MPNSPSSSFIPKQGPARHSRQVVSRQVHLFTVISYILFFSALAGSVAVFLYHKYTKNQLDAEVVALSNEIGSFSDVKMEQVRSFNMRLNQAADRIGNSVSTVAVLEALEDATVQSVGIDTLEMERVGDETYVVTAEITTNTFDSSLFQRGVYERSPIVESVTIEDLGLAGQEEDDEGAVLEKGVTFKAELFVPLNGVPYQPQSTTLITPPVVATTSSSTAALETNEISL
jgi:hypothetical protein